ncbi:2'-5' RNA ligase family protein [Caenimonas terrae]|uniref:2'-5' RNA ligase family protein n=1 Tax=Caenimonas terrae TaxID=696074 RepID=A0ABW0NF23_9BURK
MPQSGLIVRVPQAEERFGALRRRFDPQARLGVPAHVTVLFPFMAPEEIGAAECAALAQVFARFVQFPFVLGAVRRFPQAAYLAPDDPGPFIALTRAVVARFPEYPPYGGAYETVIPHLTVADGDASGAGEAELSMRKIMDAHGPLGSVCSCVSLMENSSGQWRQMHEFSLGRSRG